MPSWPPVLCIVMLLLYISMRCLSVRQCRLRLVPNVVTTACNNTHRKDIQSVARKRSSWQDAKPRKLQDNNRNRANERRIATRRNNATRGAPQKGAAQHWRFSSEATRMIKLRGCQHKTTRTHYRRPFLSHASSS